MLNNINIYNEKLYYISILFKYISFVLNLIMCLLLLNINRDLNIKLLNSPGNDVVFIYSWRSLLCHLSWRLWFSLYLMVARAL